MSFFGRGLLIVAATAAVAHVFRKDLARLLPLLQRPAAAFLADVRTSLKAEVAAADAREAQKAAAAPPSAAAAPPLTPPPPTKSAADEAPLR